MLKKLPGFYNELVNLTSLKLSEIDAIAVSIGPGSFTGLRIGLSYAKGLAYSHNLSIIPVPTMNSLVYGSNIVNSLNVMLHSHGNKYFHQQFKSINSFDKNIEVLELNTINELDDELGYNQIIHYGCDKLFHKINSDIFEVIPSAKWIGELAHQNYSKWIVNNPYKLVPNYVSPFRAEK